MSAPQTPPPCPPWCTASHEDGTKPHIGRRCGEWPHRAMVIQRDGEPEVALMGPEDVLFLPGRDARILAATVEACHPGSPLAAALREAADELYQITGGAS